jgi:hypothetical protein
MEIEEKPLTPGEENPGTEFASHPVTLLTAFIVRTPICTFNSCSSSNMDEVPITPSDEEEEWNKTINRLVNNTLYNDTTLFDLVNSTTPAPDGPDRPKEEKEDLEEDDQDEVEKEEDQDEVEKEDEEDEGKEAPGEAGESNTSTTTSTSTTTTPRPIITSTKRPMVTSTTPSSTSTSTKRPHTSTISTTSTTPYISTTTTRRPIRECSPCQPCPTVAPPVGCDPEVTGTGASAAMTLPVAVMVGAIGSLLAMALVAVVGLVLRYAPIFISGSLFVGTIIIVWYLCSKYPAVARDLGTRVIELAREATHSLADRVLGALRSQREVIQISGRGHV